MELVQIIKDWYITGPKKWAFDRQVKKLDKIDCFHSGYSEFMSEYVPALKRQNARLKKSYL